MLTGWMGDGVDTPQTVMTTRAPAVLKIVRTQKLINFMLLLPYSQQQEEELPELSASSVVETGGQGVEESRPAVVHVLV